MKTMFAFLALALLGALGATATPVSGTVTEITSFEIPRSPSGLFYYATQDILYILCGTNTNGDHYLYAYTTGGSQQCLITIPEAVGMSRVDGFYIVGSTAYIVDSQGPIYASTSGRLGGSIYAVEWTDPCTCSSGACTTSSATWSPTVTKTYTISATDSTIGDGGGNDDYFRNSGIVVTSDSFYGVNGVHPNPDLTCCYPKSIIKGDLTGTGSASQKWSFDATTIGHDVDMEGLTCGADDCATYLYAADEYNYIYKLNLGTASAADAIEVEWEASAIAGNPPDDKGFEAITYASSTGYFYTGVQEYSTIHVLQLTDPTDTTTPTPPTPVPASSSSTAASSSTVASSSSTASSSTASSSSSTLASSTSGASATQAAVAITTIVMMTVVALF